MTFCGSYCLEINSNKSCSTSQAFDGSLDRLKRTRYSIDSDFDLVIFDKTSIGKFHFKEFLEEKDSGFVKVNVFIDSEFKELFIDLSSANSDFLLKVESMPQKERAKEIKDYALDILKIRPNLIDLENLKGIFIYAVSNNKKDLVESIFEAHQRLISEEDLKNAFTCSIENGFEEIYLFFLFKDIRNLKHIFSSSYRNEIIRKFFSVYGRLISTENLKNAVNCAAEYGCNDIVLFLISKDVRNLRDVLIYAISNDKRDLVENIFESYPVLILTNFFKEAVICADKHEHKDTVLFFLEKDSRNLTDIFIYAFFNNRKWLIEKIFEKYEDLISKEDLKNAISYSAEHEYKDILLFLLPKDHKSLKDVFIYVVSSNKLELVENIFNYFRELISDEVLKTAIDRAYKNGHNDVFLFLLSKNINNLKRNFINSVSDNKLELVDGIFKIYTGLIQDDILKKTFKIAFEKDFKNIIRIILLNWLRIPPEFLNKYILLSIKQGRGEILLEILLKFPEQLYLAVFNAFNSNKKELVEYILSNYENIPVIVLKKTIESSVKNKNQFIFNLILSKFPENLKFASLCVIKYECIPLVFNFLSKYPENVGLVFYNFVVINNKPIVKQFLLKYNFLSEDLEKTIKWLVESENKSMIDFILLKKPEYLRLFLINATFSGKLILIRDLCFKYSSVSSEELRNCILVAIQQGHESIVLDFLSRSPDDLGFAIVNSVLNEKDDLVKAFLPVEAVHLLKDLKNFVTELNKDSYETIVNYFVLKDKVSLEEVVLASVSCGREDLVISFLPKDKNILKTYLEQSIKIATDKGYESIADYLLLKESEEDVLAKNLLWISP